MKNPTNTTLYVVGEHSHMERTGYGEQVMYMQLTQLKPRQTNSYCVTSDFKKPAKFSTVVHCFPYTSVYGMWMCLSTACNLVGRTKHQGSKTCGQTQFSSQLPTPFLRPAHPPKQRSNPGWFTLWSANKAVTWTLQDTSTKSQNTRSLMIDSTSANARTHASNIACEGQSLWQRA